jgi:tryptophanyl-tRNA synthetase
MEKTTENPKEEKVEKKKEGLVINPNKFENNTGGDIDYQKIVNMFGCKQVDKALLERFQKLTGQEPHHFLKRDIFFAYRYC